MSVHDRIDVATQAHEHYQPQIDELIAENNRLAAELAAAKAIIAKDDNTESYRCAECGAWHVRKPTEAETPAEQWPCPNCGNRMTHAMDCLTRNREFCQMSEPRNTKPTIDELERILNNPDAPEIEITPAGEVVMKGLRHEIERAINRVSGENGSNTPDFILAEYLVSCLAAFDRAIHARERWYGYAMHVAMPDTISRPYPPTASLDGELLAEVDPCRTDISKDVENG